MVFLEGRFLYGGGYTRFNFKCHLIQRPGVLGDLCDLGTSIPLWNEIVIMGAKIGFCVAFLSSGTSNPDPSFSFFPSNVAFSSSGDELARLLNSILTRSNSSFIFQLRKNRPFGFAFSIIAKSKLFLGFAGRPSTTNK